MIGEQLPALGPLTNEQCHLAAGNIWLCAYSVHKPGINAGYLRCNGGSHLAETSVAVYETRRQFAITIDLIVAGIALNRRRRHHCPIT